MLVWSTLCRPSPFEIPSTGQSGSMIKKHGEITEVYALDQSSGENTLSKPDRDEKILTQSLLGGSCFFSPLPPQDIHASSFEVLAKLSLETGMRSN